MPAGRNPKSPGEWLWKPFYGNFAGSGAGLVLDADPCPHHADYADRGVHEHRRFDRDARSSLPVAGRISIIPEFGRPR